MKNVDFDTWQSICQRKAQYCRFLDTKDWDAFAELFCEGLELDVSGGTDVAPVVGRSAALEMIRSHIETAKTVHQVGSPEMSEQAPGRVQVIWAMQDVVDTDEYRIHGYGNYHETWERQGGVWRIAVLTLKRFVIDLNAK